MALCELPRAVWRRMMGQRDLMRAHRLDDETIIFWCYDGITGVMTWMTADHSHINPAFLMATEDHLVGLMLGPEGYEEEIE